MYAEYCSCKKLDWYFVCYIMYTGYCSCKKFSWYLVCYIIYTEHCSCKKLSWYLVCYIMYTEHCSCKKCNWYLVWYAMLLLSFSFSSLLLNFVLLAFLITSDLSAHTQTSMADMLVLRRSCVLLARLESWWSVDLWLTKLILKWIHVLLAQLVPWRIDVGQSWYYTGIYVLLPTL